MANDRDPPVSPPAELNQAAQKVRPLRRDETTSTLVAKLIAPIDKIRQLSTSFGVRPYQVFLIHVRWTGLRRGMGEAQEVSRVEILPTPLVSEMTGIPEIIRALGRTEEGGVFVSEISLRYAEDDLRGLTPDLVDPDNPRTLQPNVEFYWEVVENRPLQPLAVRRRFTTGAAPSMSRDTVQWKVQLSRQDYDRSRNAQPRGGK